MRKKVINVHNQSSALNVTLYADEAMKDELAGTTAVVAILRGNRIFCVSKCRS